MRVIVTPLLYRKLYKVMRWLTAWPEKASRQPLYIAGHPAGHMSVFGSHRFPLRITGHSPYGPEDCLLRPQLIVPLTAKGIPDQRAKSDHHPAAV